MDIFRLISIITHRTLVLSGIQVKHTKYLLYLMHQCIVSFWTTIFFVDICWTKGLDILLTKGVVAMTKCYLYLLSNCTNPCLAYYLYNSSGGSHMSSLCQCDPSGPATSVCQLGPVSIAATHEETYRKLTNIWHSNSAWRNSSSIGTELVIHQSDLAILHSQSPNDGILKNNCCNIPFQTKHIS